MSEDQNVQPQDELSEDELEQVSGGSTPSVSEIVVTKSTDCTSPSITDGTSNTLAVAERKP